MYQNFSIPYLYEAQHVSGDKPPIIRSTYVPDNVHQLHVQQPSVYEKPEAARAVLGSWWWAVYRLKHVELYINMEY
jgi:hypothetical protein